MTIERKYIIFVSKQNQKINLAKIKLNLLYYALEIILQLKENIETSNPNSQKKGSSGTVTTSKIL